jgi:hypothetical protein
MNLFSKNKHIASNSSSLWLSGNPHLPAARLSDLKDHWGSVVNSVVNDGTPIAIVDNALKKPNLLGIFLPQKFDSALRSARDEYGPVQIAFADRDFLPYPNVLDFHEIHDLESGLHFLFSDVSAAFELHVNEQGNACFARNVAVVQESNLDDFRL